MDKRKLHLYITAGALATLSVGFCLAHFILPDKALSEKENRALQSLPTPSVSTVTDGRFEEDFADYFSDQFPLRQGWIYGKTAAEMMLGKTESGGVFRGRDGQLFKRFTAPAEEDFAESISCLARLKKQVGKTPVYLLISPTAAAVYPERLPLACNSDDQNLYLDRLYREAAQAGLRPVDLWGAFEKVKEEKELFYKTDHHWTGEGALTAFESYAAAANIDTAKSEYERLPVSDSFVGTLAATYGFPAAGEEITVVRPKDPPAVVVTYPDSGDKRFSLFDTDKLKTHDQYALFMGGNFGTVILRTEVKNGERLLIIKDSYANSVLPMLAAHYERITMVDPRYYRGDLYELIENGHFDDILILGNADTFAETDLSLLK